MGISSPTLRKGFSIMEILAVLGISSLLLVLLATMFRVGFWEATRSSGRIELVRRGRQAIDNTQRYLASACQPGTRLNPSLEQAGAVFGPDALDDLNNPNPTSYVRFWSAEDFLGNTPARTARELQNSPSFYAYDIGTIPGGGELGGQDLVLRRYLVPDEPLLPTEWDTTAQPRYLARGWVFPTAAAEWKTDLWCAISGKEPFRCKSTFPVRTSRTTCSATRSRTPLRCRSR